VEILGKDRCVAISVSRPDKFVSGSMPDYLEKKYGPQGSKFTLAFFSALKGSFPDGTSIYLQERNLESIFDYAAKFEFRNQNSITTFMIRKIEKKLKRELNEEELFEVEKKMKPYDSFFNKIPLGRNTPHLVYGKINPADLVL